MKAEEIREFLSNTLIDIPLARKQPEEQTLTALFRGCIGYPVFPDQHSAVPAWLQEATPLAQRIDQISYDLLRVRRAVVAMRLRDLNGARGEAETVIAESSDSRVLHYAHLTLARVLIRQQQFDDAHQHLKQALAAHIAKDDWLCGHVNVAQGELCLEQDETEPARAAFDNALTLLPGWAIEERVQSLQSLAFIASGKLEPKRALKYFQDAAELLEMAGIWTELVQMQLAIASLLLTRGRGNEAVTLFQQAREVCLTHGIKQWLTPIEVGLARATRSTRSPGEARNQTMDFASQCAKRGDTSGFISMILLIAGIDTDQKDYESAYRVLAVGQSISKYLKLPTAVTIFRAQINRLRDELMGDEEFKKMAEKLVDETKRKLH